MVQRGCGAGFEFETAEMIRIAAGGGADQLQSYIAPQPFITCPKNLAHGSGANFLEDSVVTYDLASHMQGQPCWHVRGARPLPSITRSDRCTCPMGLPGDTLNGKPRLAECRRAIISFRLHTFEACL